MHSWTVGQAVSRPSRGSDATTYTFSAITRVTKTFVLTDDGGKWRLSGEEWGSSLRSPPYIKAFEARHVEANREWIRRYRARDLSDKIQREIARRERDLDTVRKVAALLGIEEDEIESWRLARVPQEAPSPRPDGTPECGR